MAAAKMLMAIAEADCWKSMLRIRKTFVWRLWKEQMRWADRDIRLTLRLDRWIDG
jgi:hypothetical protein